MALSVKVERPDSWGSLRAVLGTIDFDDSYATGGEELTPAMVGLSEIKMVIAPVKGGYAFEWDAGNGTLMVIDLSDGQEVADQTDLSSLTDVAVLVIGR